MLRPTFHDLKTLSSHWATVEPTVFAESGENVFEAMRLKLWSYGHDARPAAVDDGGYQYRVWVHPKGQSRPVMGVGTNLMAAILSVYLTCLPRPKESLN